MKKILLLLITVCFTYTYSSAQFEQGTICLTGVIDFQSTGGERTAGGVTSDQPKTTVLGFVPAGMYFLNDRTAVGLGIGITNTKTTTVTPNSNPAPFPSNGSETENKTNLLSFLPMVRHILVGNERAGIGAIGMIDIGTGKNEVTTDFEDPAVMSTSADTDISTFGIAVAPHFYLFLTDNVAIESTFGHIGYGSIKQDFGAGAENTNNAFSLNLNPINSLTFGVAVYFGGSAE